MDEPTKPDRESIALPSFPGLSGVASLGMGGMGVVLAAREVFSGRPVAVKVLRRLRDTRPIIRKRLLREARVTAALPSEHVARVSSCRTLP